MFIASKCGKQEQFFSFQCCNGRHVIANLDQRIISVLLQEAKLRQKIIFIQVTFMLTTYFEFFSSFSAFYLKYLYDCVKIWKDIF